MNALGPSSNASIHNSPLFHGRDTRWHRNHDLWPEHPITASRSLDEVAQHGLGNEVISNHAVLQGTHDPQAPRRAADHFAGRVPDSLDPTVPCRHSDD